MFSAGPHLIPGLYAQELPLWGAGERKCRGHWQGKQPLPPPPLLEMSLSIVSKHGCVLRQAEPLHGNPR